MDLDVIIVLSYKSKKRVLSKIAKQRIDKALEIYKKNKVKIIFSGGYSLKSKKNIGLSEAQLMGDYAIKNQISQEDIILEEESRDTQGNAYFTKQLVKKNNWKNVLVVTSDFHLLKTKFFFDFIYGPEYNIQYLEVNSNLPKEKTRDISKSEKKSQEIMEKIYTENKIQKGEDKKIKVLLEKFYSKFN